MKGREFGAKRQRSTPKAADFAKKDRCFFGKQGRFREKAAVFWEVAVRFVANVGRGRSQTGHGLPRASVRPAHVVLPIGEHVEEQPDGHCPAPPRQVTVTPIGQAAHEGVEHNGGIGMEGMKADAHAVGGEDGRGQQVVEIDEHGSEHDEIGFATLAVGEKQQRKEERGEEMQAVVDDGAEGVEVHGRDDVERWDGWDVDGGDTLKAVAFLDGRGNDKSKVTHFLHARQ